jgi:hypothetical protein
MGKNDLDIGKLLETPVEDHVYGCTSSLVRPVESRHRKSFVEIHGRHIVDGMNKNHSFATIEFFPDGDIFRVSKIPLWRGVAGEKRDSVCLQGVECVA